MLVLVAIRAQQLPVAAVCRIVIVIAVLVVHFEELQIAVGERAPAHAAYPRKELQRLLTVTGGPALGVAPRFSHDVVQPIA